VACPESVEEKAAVDNVVESKETCGHTDNHEFVSNVETQGVVVAVRNNVPEDKTSTRDCGPPFSKAILNMIYSTYRELR
jgi:hypothetical protein